MNVFKFEIKFKVFLYTVEHGIWDITNMGYNKPNMGYNKPGYIEQLFISLDLICLKERSDITNPRYVGPIAASLECSI